MTRDALLSYLRESDAVAVAARLPTQIECFARDARAACARWGEAYPDAVEQAILRDLQGVLERLPPSRG